MGLGTETGLQPKAGRERLGEGETLNLLNRGKSDINLLMTSIFSINDQNKKPKKCLCVLCDSVVQKVLLICLG